MLTEETVTDIRRQSSADLRDERNQRITKWLISVFLMLVTECSIHDNTGHISRAFNNDL